MAIIDVIRAIVGVNSARMKRGYDVKIVDRFPAA